MGFLRILISEPNKKNQNEVKVVLCLFLCQTGQIKVNYFSRFLDKELLKTEKTQN